MRISLGVGLILFFILRHTKDDIRELFRLTGFWQPMTTFA